jgi:hypothetical protein
MTDDPTPTPAQEREVTRLLADARHTEPIPGDVAARLDRVLAELGRGEVGDAHPVTVLASRRRRRVSSLLVAAAAVVAIGVGLGQVIDVNQGSSSDSAAEKAVDAPRTSSLDSSGSRELDAEGSAPTYALQRPVRVRPDHFATDVTRVRRLTTGKQADSLTADADPDSNADSSTGSRALRGTFDCTPAAWGRGTFVAVRFDHHPGVLVFRRATGETQVVDLFQCGSSDVLRSVTLPSR